MLSSRGRRRHRPQVIDCFCFHPRVRPLIRPLRGSLLGQTTLKKQSGSRPRSGLTAGTGASTRPSAGFVCRFLFLLSLPRASVCFPLPSHLLVQRSTATSSSRSGRAHYPAAAGALFPFLGARRSSCAARRKREALRGRSTTRARVSGCPLRWMRSGRQRSPPRRASRCS